MGNRTFKMPQHIPVLETAEQLPLTGPLQRVDVGERMRRRGDLVIACALLTLTFPLMLFVALAIKCETPGPVFERQDRAGYGGRRFKLLTFRTAVHDAKNRHPTWAREPTRVGALLRYTRIDGLPQLINVLRGDIGLIDAGTSSGAFWD